MLINVREFLVHAGIDNRKVSEAVALILKELRKIKHSLVTADEFRRAKDFYLGQLSLALEDTLDHMLWLGENVAALDKTISLPEVLKEVSALKREHIREAASAVFRENKLNLALIGPLKGQEEELRGQLKIGQ